MAWTDPGGRVTSSSVMALRRIEAAATSSTRGKSPEAGRRRGILRKCVLVPLMIGE